MKILYPFFIVVIFHCLPGFSQGDRLPLLKISEDNRYLLTQDDQPFLWLGDTAWELFHRLNRAETIQYLDDRAAKGFTVIQAVILAELDGLNTPNANGDLPFVNNEPTKWNESYFRHVDFVIQEAEKRGLYVGLLPTWGDKFNKAWGVGPEIFTPFNAETYGKMLAHRYSGSNNIVWIMGGDRWPEDEEDKRIIRGMVNGIRKADNLHLITYHPSGGKKATDYFDEDWLDIDMFQSGHDRRVKDYKFVLASRRINQVRPVINGEPRYENHPNRFKPEVFGWMDDSDVRTSAYWTMLTGAAGYTYGCHDIWQMFSADRKPISKARSYWKESLDLPGANDIRHLKELLETFAWQEMEYDPSIILNNNPEDSAFMVSSIGKKKDYIIAYTPMGKPISIDLSKMQAENILAYWLNPRDGQVKEIGKYKKTDRPELAPWSDGRGSDFVLILTDERVGYKLTD